MALLKSQLGRWLIGGLIVSLIIGGLWMRGTHWKNIANAHAIWSGQVLFAIREASDSPKADYETAPGQIIALGESNRKLKIAIDDSNEAINVLAAEAVRLRAKASELQEIARKAEAQRRAAYARLSDMAITPGARDDCMALLAEAEEALDLVRSAGL